MVECLICKAEKKQSKNYADHRGLQTHSRKVHGVRFKEYKERYLSQEEEAAEETSGLEEPDLRSEIDDIKTSLAVLSRNLPPLSARGEIERETERVAGYAVERKIALGPKVLFYFADAVEKGFTGDLSSFLNSIVDTFYKSRGMTIALTERKEF